MKRIAALFILVVALTVSVRAGNMDHTVSVAGNMDAPAVAGNMDRTTAADPLAEFLVALLDFIF